MKDSMELSIMKTKEDTIGPSNCLVMPFLGDPKTIFASAEQDWRQSYGHHSGAIFLLVSTLSVRTGCLSLLLPLLLPLSLPVRQPAVFADLLLTI